MTKNINTPVRYSRLRATTFALGTSAFAFGKYLCLGGMG